MTTSLLQKYSLRKYLQKNIKGMVITGTEVIQPSNFEEYEKLYNEILSKNRRFKSR